VQTLLSLTVNDEQGFKDASGVYYRFTPDDGHDGESSSKAKVDLNYRTIFSCANIEVCSVHAYVRLCICMCNLCVVCMHVCSVVYMCAHTVQSMRNVALVCDKNLSTN